SQRLTDRHIDLPRLREGGVDALVFALFIPASLSPEEGWELTLKLHQITLDHLVPGMEQVGTEQQVREAAARGAVGVILGLENGRPLSVPGALAHCARIGVRYVTLTHWASHEWCDASTDEPRHGGLSEEGVKIVREMNRLGVLPDLSHISDDAVRHVLDVSKAPPLASHSSSRALCDHPRNLSDDLVKEIAERDGLVMANTYPAFVGQQASRVEKERMARLKPAFEEMDAAYLREPGKHWRERERLLKDNPLPPVPLSVFVDHVIRLVELGGEEHVGIGTDLDGISEPLEGFEDVSRFPNLTAALLERGVDKAGVRLILGENFLRVLRRAEQLAV
ncbi:MAG TPA: dipeptidase, partial [Thermoanaerobaculia bacterium]|nr:dipeptidase [Thermoanaerobaculia bacterium]